MALGTGCFDESLEQDFLTADGATLLQSRNKVQSAGLIWSEKLSGSTGCLEYTPAECAADLIVNQLVVRDLFKDILLYDGNIFYGWPYILPWKNLLSAIGCEKHRRSLLRRQ